MKYALRSEPINSGVDAHKRLTREEALHLYENMDFLTLGHLANTMRLHLHPQGVVTYAVDRNINYTNVCISGCKFCAFYKRPNDPSGYVLSREDLSRKIEETISLGGTQILLQGGMNPKLDLDYYVDLLQGIKRRYSIHVHGFSPPEIFYLAQKSSLSIKKILEILIDAGLGSIPGGGAEILVDEIRSVVSPRKCSAQQWLTVMETAHMLGLRTTATMMFGHIEKPGHRIEHLFRIRDLQDRTGGFTAFIPWSFQPRNTELDGYAASAIEYLRVLAISRLVLDNVPNIQASWVTQGPKIAQLSLFFGANDMGSTMIEENVVAAAGVSFRQSEQDLIRIIENAGFKPAKRNTFYEILDQKCE